MAVPNTTLQCQRPDLYLGLNCNESYRDCGFPPDNSLHLVRRADDPNLPWPGIFIGLTISSIWYWCSDQVGNNISIFVNNEFIKGNNYHPPFGGGYKVTYNLFM